MSAWPEAVWIIRETQKALNMDERLNQLEARLVIVENRLFFVSNNTPVIPIEPGEDERHISEGSLWFHIKQ